MKAAFKLKWFFIPAFVVSVIIVIILINMSASKNDLSLWVNESDRPALLSHLLKENVSSHVDRKRLITSSPLFGLSKSQVLALLGPADETYSDELIYHIGNIDVSLVGNMIVPQNAMLYLYFIDDECIEYSIYT